MLPEKWLTQFLESKKLSGPDGRMLYNYRLSTADYQSLRETLKFSMCFGEMKEVALRVKRFPALFVLYAAEWCRREYDGGHWKWEPIIENFEGGVVPVPTRSEIVTKGLAYWCHKPSDQGQKFIWAIIAQSGLPLRLIEQGEGKFSELMKRTLGQAIRYHWDKSTITERVGQLAESLSLPMPIRIPEIYKLIAEMVETTIELRRDYKLNGAADPIQELNAKYPSWTDRYPLQMDDRAAKSLLEGLVKEASQQFNGLTNGVFSVERRLSETSPATFHLYSRIIYKPRIELDALADFFQLQQDEAKFPNNFTVDANLVHRQPVIEARKILGAEMATVTLQGVKKIWRDEEACLEHTLYLRARQDLAGPVALPGGAALERDEPWVFVTREEKLTLWAVGGAKLPDEEAFITLPAGWRIELSTPSSLACPMGICVVGNENLPMHRIQGVVTLRQGEKAYRIRTRQTEAESELYAWEGKRLPFTSNPRNVFLGLPRLYRYRAEAEPEQVLAADLKWFMAGEAIADPRSAHGPVEVHLLREGERIAQFRFVVLNRGAIIRFRSGQNPSEGEVVFSGWGKMELAVNSQEITAQIAVTEREYVARMRCDNTPPETAHISVRWPFNSQELHLTLPFPSCGGRFFDEAGNALRNGDILSMRRLIGARLQIFDGNPDAASRYQITLRLVEKNGTAKEPVEKHHRIDTPDGRAELRLIDWQRDIEMLMGLSDRLDAQVDAILSVGGKSNQSIQITRYDTTLDTKGDFFSLPRRCIERLTEDELGAISCLAAPIIGNDKEGIVLEQGRSQGIATGTWSARNMDCRQGAWLIYPGETSSLLFRPTIWSNSDIESAMVNQQEPIVTAMLVSDSRKRDVDIEAALTQATRDYQSPAWSLIERQWRVFHHLPLSSLDIWRRIAANPTIAAHALLRLELTTEQMTNFLCRLREELGCALELVAVSVWKQGIRQLMQLWTERLGEEEIALSVVSKRLDLIKQHVPAIRLILYFMRFQNGLEPSSDLLAVGQQYQRDRDSFTRKLWQGDDSLLQTLLLRNHAEDEWPKSSFFLKGAWPSFGEMCRAEIPDNLLKNLFWMQSQDFKMTVVNLPILCALWAITDTDQTDWKRINWMLALRQVRNFDPLWFEQAYYHATAACLAYGLIK